ncbi:MAG: thiosulfate oxidation carrier complex protein SoxZ [Sulfuricurvum sp.]|nr:thiosulfate oxidation carrier complex protein SoxZ [Sulfuricurvum sp.]
MELRGVVKILDQSYKVGDVVKAKIIVIHKMDTGFTKDKESGKQFPRFYMKEITATYNGVIVAHFDLDVATSQNPVIQFPLKVTAPGTLVVDFVNSEDEKGQKTVAITPAG